MRSAVIFIIAALFCFSCSEAPKDQSTEVWPVDFEALVDLHCKARDLRKQRFDLADSIRSYTELKLSEPRMNQTILNEDSTLLKWDALKNSLVNQSEAIADSIMTHLEEVIVKLDTEQKRILNDSLNRTVIRRGCE